MVLSGHEIRQQLGKNIVIDPFDEARLNPNSYNLTLHDELMIYEEVVLDMRRANRVRRLTIPPEGLVLQPNQLYLGRTIERTETRNLVPMIEGRSSIGRLGLFVHVTAGFGDVGFCGYWTLEMFAVQPVRIYAGRGDLPDLLSRHPRHVHRVRQRQVPAQQRHPAQPAVQGADPQGVATTRSGNSPSASSARRISHRRRCHCWLVQQCGGSAREHCWTSQQWHPRLNRNYAP